MRKIQRFASPVQKAICKTKNEGENPRFSFVLIPHFKLASRIFAAVSPEGTPRRVFSYYTAMEGFMKIVCVNPPAVVKCFLRLLTGKGKKKARHNDGQGC